MWKTVVVVIDDHNTTASKHECLLCWRLFFFFVKISRHLSCYFICDFLHDRSVSTPSTLYFRFLFFNFLIFLHNVGICYSWVNWL